MSNWIVFEALAVFAIWMQRKGRWAAFLQAASGQVTVSGSQKSSGTAAYAQDPNTGKLGKAGSQTGGASGGGGTGGNYNPLGPGNSGAGTGGIVIPGNQGQ